MTGRTSLHNWVENVIGHVRRGARNVPVTWFVKCRRCGCLVWSYGGQLYYRAAPTAPWSTDAPPCVGRAS